MPAPQPRAPHLPPSLSEFIAGPQAARAATADDLPLIDEQLWQQLWDSLAETVGGSATSQSATNDKASDQVHSQAHAQGPTQAEAHGHERTQTQGHGPAPQLLREVASRYAPTAQQRLHTLRAALKAGQFAEAARLAHAVKGNSAMIGATRVVSLASELEQSLPRLPIVTAEVLAQVNQLERACAQTAAVLAARTGNAEQA